MCVKSQNFANMQLRKRKIPHTLLKSKRKLGLMIIIRRRQKRKERACVVVVLLHTQHTREYVNDMKVLSN